MHKLSPRVLIGLAVVGLTVLTWGCSRPADSTSVPVDTSSGVQRGNLASATSLGKTEVNLSIPDSGSVTLVNNQVEWGQISVDQENRQIIVMAGSNSKKVIPFDTLGRVIYEQVYRSSRTPEIRGDGSQATPVSLNIEVGWGDFSIVGEKRGQARVMLPTKGNEGLISVAQDNQYVVEEIMFDPQQQKMIIQVRAY